MGWSHQFWPVHPHLKFKKYRYLVQYGYSLGVWWWGESQIYPNYLLLKLPSKMHNICPFFPPQNSGGGGGGNSIFHRLAKVWTSSVWFQITRNDPQATHWDFHCSAPRQVLGLPQSGDLIFLPQKLQICARQGQSSGLSADPKLLLQWSC